MHWKLFKPFLTSFSQRWNMIFIIFSQSSNSKIRSLNWNLISIFWYNPFKQNSTDTMHVMKFCISWVEHAFKSMVSALLLNKNGRESLFQASEMSFFSKVYRFACAHFILVKFDPVAQFECNIRYFNIVNGNHPNML